VRALVTLGADVLADFPDRLLAERALAASDFVVVVGGHRSEEIERADVVLPAAVAHERPGTTTNIEGRVSRLGHKVVSPGVAWPDWMIAAELADALGQDLGLTGTGEIWSEIERLAPAHAGVTVQVLDAAASHDGVLVPFTPSRPRPPVTPIDPMAMPGIESVERQGAIPWVGSAEPAGEEPGAAVVPGPAAAGGGPPLLGPEAPDGPSGPRIPPPDNYSLRLVSTRRLYDAGSAVRASASLARLAPALMARANPYDLDRLGVTTGGRVRVRSTRGSLVLPALADEGVPRGVLDLEFNLPADGAPGANAAALFIDAAAVVNDVRLESV
jgi:predicted molibdopterin-dependent oxidoreductase YjgC